MPILQPASLGLEVIIEQHFGLLSYAVRRSRDKFSCLRLCVVAVSQFLPINSCPFSKCNTYYLITLYMNSSAGPIVSDLATQSSQMGLKEYHRTSTLAESVSEKADY